MPSTFIPSLPNLSHFQATPNAPTFEPGELFIGVPNHMRRQTDIFDASRAQDFGIAVNRMSPVTLHTMPSVRVRAAESDFCCILDNPEDPFAKKGHSDTGYCFRHNEVTTERFRLDLGLLEGDHASTQAMVAHEMTHAAQAQTYPQIEQRADNLRQVSADCHNFFQASMQKPLQERMQAMGEMNAKMAQVRLLEKHHSFSLVVMEGQACLAEKKYKQEVIRADLRERFPWGRKATLFCIEMYLRFVSRYASSNKHHNAGLALFEAMDKIHPFAARQDQSVAPVSQKATDALFTDPSKVTRLLPYFGGWMGFLWGNFVDQEALQAFFAELDQPA